MIVNCVFCGIINGVEPASFVHEDEVCVAFLSLLQVRPGETVIIPKDHIDHFTDIPEETATHIMKVAHRLGRVVRERMNPQRIGYVVHGYGVAHAHLILVPQHSPNDITSERFAQVKDSKLSFSPRILPVIPRSDLDALASRIRSWMQEAAI